MSEERYNNRLLTRISSILVFASILIFATPLWTSSGYISIAVFVSILCIGYKKLLKRTVLMIAFFGVFFVVYIILSPSISANIFKGGIIMFSLAVVMTMVFPEKIYNGNLLIDCRGEKIFRIVYLVMWIVTMEQLIAYMYNNWDGWKFRVATASTSFLANYHHVDFSVIVICVFLLGAKRGYYAKSLILAIVSLVALPTRTLQLFFILFIFCRIFQKQIFGVIDHKIIKHSFIWIILMVFGIALFSAIWIFVLVEKIAIVDGHMGLYDTSNYQRFISILYSLKVILDKKLIVSGVSVTPDFGEMTSFPLLHNWYGVISVGPHNTYVTILLNYSVVFGGFYLYLISRIIDKVMSMEMIPYIIPYLLCGCILHDMLNGPRMLLYLAVLILPLKRKKQYMKIMGHRRIRLINERIII